MSSLTLSKSRHRVAVWTFERRMFDTWFPRATQGRHTATKCQA
jgi:hypothetical protein